MILSTWLAFTAASAVLLIIPGPTVLLRVSCALGKGRRTALPMAIGVALVRSRARKIFDNPQSIRISNRTGGTPLVGEGLATVAARSHGGSPPSRPCNIPAP